MTRGRHFCNGTSRVKNVKVNERNNERGRLSYSMTAKTFRDIHSYEAHSYDESIDAINSLKRETNDKTHIRNVNANLTCCMRMRCHATHRERENEEKNKTINDNTDDHRLKIRKFRNEDRIEAVLISKEKSNKMS